MLLDGGHLKVASGWKAFALVHRMKCHTFNRINASLECESLLAQNNNTT